MRSTFSSTVSFNASIAYYMDNNFFPDLVDAVNEVADMIEMRLVKIMSKGFN